MYLAQNIDKAMKVTFNLLTDKTLPHTDPYKGISSHPSECRDTFFYVLKCIYFGKDKPKPRHCIYVTKIRKDTHRQTT